MTNHGENNLDRRLRRALQTTAGMKNFLNDVVGAGNWKYDASEDVWLTPNPHHSGAGRRFLIIRRGGDWTTAVPPSEAIS